MKKLNWSDILIDFSNLDLATLYSDWSWLLSEELTKPIMMSAFGDLFFEGEDKKIYFLDTIEGKIVIVSESKEEFNTFINNKENQENYLLTSLIATMVDKNIALIEGQSYSFKIPMILGGQATSDNVEVMSLNVWLSIIGQLHRQLKDLPNGTKISKFKMI